MAKRKSALTQILERLSAIERRLESLEARPWQIHVQPASVPTPFYVGTPLPAWPAPPDVPCPNCGKVGWHTCSICSCSICWGTTTVTNG